MPSKPSGRTGAQRDHVKDFHPCLEPQGSFHPATLLPGAGFLNGDTANASPSQGLPLRFGRPGTVRGTAAHDPCLQDPVGCGTTSQPGELVREDLGRGEDGKIGGHRRRSFALCKPAFQSLPLSQKLPLVLLRQDAAAFIPAPALPASATGQTRVALLPCKGRLSSPPPLCLPLLCRNWC